MENEIKVRDAVLDVKEVDTTQIARVIDDINILSQQIWNIDLFQPRLIPLSRIVPYCQDNAWDFDVNCACLGSFIDSLDVKSIKTLIPEEILKEKYTENNCHLVNDQESIERLKKIFSITEEVKFFEWRPLYSIDYLSIFLNNEIENSKELIQKIREMRRLRNIVPVVHKVDREQAEKTFNAVGVEFPIENYEEAWKRIIQEFINLLKNFRELLREEKKQRRQGL